MTKEEKIKALAAELQKIQDAASVLASLCVSHKEGFEQAAISAGSTAMYDGWTEHNGRLKEFREKVAAVQARLDSFSELASTQCHD